MKNISFSKKLLYGVLSVLIITSSISTYLIYNKSFNATKNISKKYMKELGHKNALEIKGNIEKSIVLIKTFSSTLETALEENFTYSKPDLISLMSSVLKKNPYIVGIWLYLEPNTFYENNPKMANRYSHDETGRFSPYVLKENGNLNLMWQYPVLKANPWILEPMKSGKEFITEPYKFEVDGKNVLNTTVSIPMYHNGKIVGIVGIDISLDSIVQRISKLKLLENGYGYILTADGTIIAHPNEKHHGKKITEVDKSNTSKEILKNIKDKKEFFFDKVSTYNGMASYNYLDAFNIADSGVNWGFALSVPDNEYLNDAFTIKNFSILASLVSTILIALVLFYYTKVLNLKLNSIQNGLNDFFNFLNKQTKTAKEIEVTNEDEFGKMAININQNIKTISSNIQKETLLLDDVKKVVNSVNQGFIDRRITHSSNTDTLNELKELINQMLGNLHSFVGNDINKLASTLEEYSNHNFTAKLDSNSSGKLGEKIISMNNMITQMLQQNQKDGKTLEQSSYQLNNNVETLTQNAIKQTNSLEQTTGAIGQISEAIRDTSSKSTQMSNISSYTKDSAIKGKNLASQTAVSMDEINEKVAAINEAITVIDQIAFQTNILSLNAAVEASTAGEAGKGFAVVAQEVRNLANRSGDAAKEISKLVESATIQANEGKAISDSMIEGFNDLETKVIETNKLIDSVTNAAKDQESKINQISEIVNELNRFTSENTQIANQTNDIANQTKQIASEVVENVKKNNFEGKENI